MSKDGKPASDERAARLAAALKDNLRRRKAQVRNRRDIDSCDSDGGASDSSEPDGGDAG